MYIQQNRRKNAILEFFESKICACTCCCIQVSIDCDAYPIAFLVSRYVSYRMTAVSSQPYFVQSFVFCTSHLKSLEFTAFIHTGHSGNNDFLLHVMYHDIISHTWKHVCWAENALCPPHRFTNTHYYLSHVMRKPTIWFPNRSDTNRAAQAQKMTRCLKLTKRR